MTTPGLAPPPPDVARRAPTPPRAPLRGRPAAHPRRAAPYERVLGWALLLSLLLHSAVLLLPGRFMSVDREVPRAPSADAPSEPFAGLEWVVPVPEGAEGDSPAAPAPEAQATEPVPAVLRPRPGEEAPVPTAPPETPAEAGVPGGRADTREALRPGYRDPRLYVDPDALGVRGEEKSDHEQYMEHLQARIDAVNDSMGLAAARAQAAKDWTFRDKEGRRWGISDEGLHLGGFTVPRALVPLPAPTGDNQSLEAAREEQRQRDEIRRQEEVRERRDTTAARARATRERNGGKPPGGGG